MAGEVEDEIPGSGAVFTFGKSKFADNIPSKFWLKNDVPRKIACGDEHTALITKNGKLFMFGSNNWGQLGLGSKSSVNKPTCVKALKSEKVEQVACGRNHTLIYTAQGNLYATGGNSEGQLGLGDCEERTAFQSVDFVEGPIKMLAAGSNTSAALTESGKLFMWGDNAEGQAGLGNKNQASTPQEVIVGQPVSWVSCGYYHSALITDDGVLYTFGEWDSGKLGLGIDQLVGHRLPQRVKSIPESVTQVVCGGGHTVVLTDEKVYTFGLGQFGQLGHGTMVFESRLPQHVEHFKRGRVSQVSCGENHSAVITDSGLLYTFGDGRHGKLGLGEENFTNQFKPTLCPRFLKYNVQAATCGGCHMVVLAQPREHGHASLTVEDDDVMEDFLEKSYAEALGSSGDSATLQRSLSARVRRRERERSPDQFGAKFSTLPARTLGYPQPISSHISTTKILPPQPARRKLLNGIHSKPNSNTTQREQTNQQRGGNVDNLTDADSVKDLGETTDFLNMTHVMKMGPDEKTLTLSPIQKDLRWPTVEEVEQDEDEDEEDEEEEEEEEEETEENEETCAGEDTEGQSSETLEDSMEKPTEENLSTISDVPQVESVSDTIAEEKTEDSSKPANGVASTDSDIQSVANKKLSLFRRLSSSRLKRAEKGEDTPAETVVSSSANTTTTENVQEETNSTGAHVKPIGGRARGPRSGTCALL